MAAQSGGAWGSDEASSLVEGDVPTNPTRYRAFISYSRHDEAWARRIHAALEAYRAPRGVGAHVDHRTRRLGRFFRDDDEMPACHSLGASIEQALSQADALIVICSPFAARSAWVDMEVRRFRTDPQARVLAVIVGGAPNADDPEQECFCPGLRWRVTPDGRLTDIQDEPLAPDIRREGLERVTARLAAGLLGVSFDHLWRRRNRQTIRRRALSTAAAATVAALLAIGSHQIYAPTSQPGPQHIGEAALTLTHARRILNDARASGDVFAMESALRLTMTVETEAPGARDFMVEALAATRTEWRFDDLGGALRHIALTDGGDTALALAASGRATVINLKTGLEVTRVELGGAPLALSQDGGHALITTPEGPMLWRTDNWTALRIPGGAPTCAAFSKWTSTLLTCDAGGGARLWNTETAEYLGALGEDGPVQRAASFDEPGTRALLSSGYGAWTIWDVESGEMTATLRYQGRQLDWATPGIYHYFVSGLVASPYGAVLTPTGAVPLTAHDHAVTIAALSPGGAPKMQVASGDAGGRLVVAAIDHPVAHKVFDLKGHDSPITALAITPDMSRIASGDDKGVLRIWSLAGVSDGASALLERGVDIAAVICAADAPRLPASARRISDADIAALPHLARHHGEDVCAPKGT